MRTAPVPRADSPSKSTGIYCISRITYATPAVLHADNAPAGALSSDDAEDADAGLPHALASAQEDPQQPSANARWSAWGAEWDESADEDASAKDGRAPAGEHSRAVHANRRSAVFSPDPHEHASDARTTSTHKTAVDGGAVSVGGTANIDEGADQMQSHERRAVQNTDLASMSLSPSHGSAVARSGTPTIPGPSEPICGPHELPWLTGPTHQSAKRDASADGSPSARRQATTPARNDDIPSHPSPLPLDTHVDTSLPVDLQQTTPCIAEGATEAAPSSTAAPEQPLPSSAGQVPAATADGQAHTCEPHGAAVRDDRQTGEVAVTPVASPALDQPDADAAAAASDKPAAMPPDAEPAVRESLSAAHEAARTDAHSGPDDGGVPSQCTVTSTGSAAEAAEGPNACTKGAAISAANLVPARADGGDGTPVARDSGGTRSERVVAAGMAPGHGAAADSQTGGHREGPKETEGVPVPAGGAEGEAEGAGVVLLSPEAGEVVNQFTDVLSAQLGGWLWGGQAPGESPTSGGTPDVGADTRSTENGKTPAVAAARDVRECGDDDGAAHGRGEENGGVSAAGGAPKVAAAAEQREGGGSPTVVAAEVAVLRELVAAREEQLASQAEQLAEMQAAMGALQVRRMHGRACRGGHVWFGRTCMLPCSWRSWRRSRGLSMPSAVQLLALRLGLLRLATRHFDLIPMRCCS